MAGLEEFVLAYEVGLSVPAVDVEDVDDYQRQDICYFNFIHDSQL